MPIHHDTAAFVLAGGQSTRMGTNKALLHIEGEPLIARAVQKLRAVCPQVAIAGGVPELSLYAPVIPDEFPGRGPLGGIVSALAKSTAAWNLFLAVDVPFFPLEGLETLLDHTDEENICVMAECEGLKHPLCAAYARRAEPMLRAELLRGNGKVTSAIAAAGPVRYVAFQHGSWLRNLNTVEDLALARGDTP